MNIRMVIAGFAVALTAGACNSFNESRGRGDAPVARYDDSPAQVINMPDKFANIAFKCVGGNGIYSTTRPAAPVVVPNDPECAEAADSPQ